MFFDDEEKNKKTSFADLVNSINGNSNQISNKPSFADLVETINPSKKVQSNKSSKTAIVEELKPVYETNTNKNEQAIKKVNKTNNTNKTDARVNNSKIDKIKSYNDMKKSAINSSAENKTFVDKSTLKTSKNMSTKELINKGKDLLTKQALPIAAEVAGKKLENEGLIKGSVLFEDGYDPLKFEALRTIGATTADAGLKFIEGIGQIGEATSDLTTHIAAQFIDMAGNREWADRARKLAIEDRNSKLFDEALKDIRPNSVLGEGMEETVQSMGYSTGLMAFELATPFVPHLGTAVMFESATGSGLNESFSQENVTNQQAWIRGLASGAIETATERMFGLFGNLDTGFANAVSRKITSGFGKILARMGVQGLGEGAEELISYTANYYFDRLMDAVSNGKGAKFSKDWNWEEVGKQFGIAFLSAFLMGAGENSVEVGQIIKNDKLNFAKAIEEAGFRTDIKAKAEDINTEIEKIEKQLAKKPNDTQLMQQLQSKYQELNTLVVNNSFLQDKKQSSENNVGVFYTTNFENGQINVKEVVGKSIQNPNSKVDVSPVVVYNNNVYNVIDANTGVTLDSTPYETLLGARVGFNEKMSNLDNKQVNSINAELNFAKFAINNKISEAINQTEAELNAQNYSKSTQTSEAKHSEDLSNQTTNNMSNNLKNVRTQPGKSDSVGKTKTSQRERKFTQQISEYKENAKKGNSVQDDITKINTNVLEGISKNKQDSFINEYLRDEVQGHDYYVDNDKIIANSTTTGKLSKGKTFYDKKIDIALRKELKANVISNLENIISTSQIYQSNRKDTKKHTFADTFDRRKSIFNYKGQNYEVMFEIGKKNGINTLYGIEHIKRTQKNRLNLPQLTTQSGLQNTQKSGRIS